MTCAVIEWTHSNSAGEALGARYPYHESYLPGADTTVEPGGAALRGSTHSLAPRVARALRGADESDVVHDSPNWAGERLRLLEARGFVRVNDPRKRPK